VRTRLRLRPIILTDKETDRKKFENFRKNLKNATQNSLTEFSRTPIMVEKPKSGGAFSVKLTDNSFGKI
jgi:hypothetical protein